MNTGEATVTNDKDLFATIEKVMEERAAEGGQHTHTSKILDVFKIVAKKMPEQTLACGDLAILMREIGVTLIRASISRSLIELQDQGEIEYAGKEFRTGKSKSQQVPVYRISK